MKACPFCKGEGYLHVGHLYRWVECESCEAQGPVKETDEEAIAAWNEAKR